jgi:hypothetical protein
MRKRKKDVMSKTARIDVDGSSSEVGDSRKAGGWGTALVHDESYKQQRYGFDATQITTTTVPTTPPIDVRTCPATNASHCCGGPQPRGGGYCQDQRRQGRPRRTRALYG